MGLSEKISNWYHGRNRNSDICAGAIFIGITTVALWDLGIFNYRNREPVKINIQLPQIESPTPNHLLLPDTSNLEDEILDEVDTQQKPELKTSSINYKLSGTLILGENTEIPFYMESVKTEPSKEEQKK